MINTSQRSNISRFLIVGLVFLNFYPLISLAKAVDNPMSFGIPANDGTSIQAFVTTSATVNGKKVEIPLKIPQDTDTLEYDYFYVFIDIRDLEERTFSLYFSFY